jgi:protein-S-isoprenylcysteine O-methyltransferase Ste14
MGVFRFAGWLVSVVYSTIPALWLIVHPRARKLGRATAPLMIVGPVWFGLWLIMSAITSHWRHVTLYNNSWAWLGSAPLFVVGMFLYWQSLGEFTFDQVLGRSELHPHKYEQRLVTTGIRERVRHPIYLAHFVELLGWSIGTGLVVVYAMTAFAALSGALMIRIEDHELEQRFGDEYRRYRERVPAVLPRL